eukprot:TRINITY_DN43271_c0_g1_i1.p1 TRINITY_DN43271_c0_g1~~TRINITY_DN43271_c0_g1_i1.p1  ORF type:complete len:354 (+),score=98.92 TRINITY_DN43271_c0_g1_i1:142-1062(+)
MDGKIHTLKLSLAAYYRTVSSIEEADCNKDVKNFTLIDVKVVNTAPNDKFVLAGTLDMNLDGTMFWGDFGNLSTPDAFDTKNNCWTFRSKSKLTVNHYDDYFGFCLPNSGTTMEIKVDVATILSNACLVKDIGTSGLLEDIKTLLENADDYSDFTIICDGQTFPCHEVILRTRSSVFNKMLQQEMKESNTRTLTIEDASKSTVDAILEFIYTGESSKVVENMSEMLYLADKYDIHGLLKYCFHHIPEVKDEMIMDILVVADRHRLEDFKKAGMQRIIQNKTKFLNDKECTDKMIQAPHLMLELLKL